MTCAGRGCGSPGTHVLVSRAVHPDGSRDGLVVCSRCARWHAERPWLARADVCELASAS